jgi:hypothetical protein
MLVTETVDWQMSHHHGSRMVPFPVTFHQHLVGNNQIRWVSIPQWLAILDRCPRILRQTQMVEKSVERIIPILLHTIHSRCGLKDTRDSNQSDVYVDSDDLDTSEQVEGILSKSHSRRVMILV